MNKKLQYVNLPIFIKGKLQKKEEKTSKKSKLFSILLIIIIVFMLLISGYSLAKTIEEKTLKVSAQIAEPILVIENNPKIEITESKNEGVYVFKVKNYDVNNKITQTDLKYYIEIISNLDSSINIEMYENEKKINLEKNKTEYIEMSKNSKEEKEYKMKITYIKDNSKSMADILENLQVKIHTEQIKA